MIHRIETRSLICFFSFLFSLIFIFIIWSFLLSYKLFFHHLIFFFFSSDLFPKLWFENWEASSYTSCLLKYSGPLNQASYPFVIFATRVLFPFRHLSVLNSLLPCYFDKKIYDPQTKPCSILFQLQTLIYLQCVSWELVLLSLLLFCQSINNKLKPNHFVNNKHKPNHNHSLVPNVNPGEDLVWDVPAVSRHLPNKHGWNRITKCKGQMSPWQFFSSG